MERIRELFKVDVSDEQHVKTEQKRYVPWNVDPFRKHGTGIADEDSETEERPQEWLELAGDLAWTTTFSSVTSNQAITDSTAVWNYAVFFFLTWHLWATQTSYDIRFYTHDWWHRVCFVAQLGIYAILAACSGSFNVGWHIDSGWEKAPKGDVSTLTAETMDQNQIDLITKNFRAINIWLGISRTLLFAQYARVWYYRRRSGQNWDWKFRLIPLATLFSAILFFVCFIIVKKMADSPAAAYIQLSLWVVAVLIQPVAAALTPEERKGALKNECAMSDRIASFTVIIMGEGLNGIVGTLRHNMNSLGLSHRMLGESVAILFMLYFIWLLYFDGFRSKYSPVGAIREVWIYLHFLFHLSLIMLLEGVKNLFTYMNVLDLLKRLRTALDAALGALHDTGHFPEHPELETQLRVIGISWKEQADSLGDAILRDDTEWTDESWNNVSSIFWKWWGGVTHNVILLYNEDTDEEAESSFQTFMNSTETAIAEDYNSEASPLYAAFSDPYFAKMAYTGKWIIIIGGSLMIFMAYIKALQCRSSNRYTWRYSSIRYILGLFLVVMGGVGARWVDREEWVFSTLPLITSVYFFGTAWDWLMLHRSVRYLRSLGTLSPHLPPLPYGPGRPKGSESPPNVTDAQDTKGSSGLLDAAGGETEKSHREKSISSSV